MKLNSQNLTPFPGKSYEQVFKLFDEFLCDPSYRNNIDYLHNDNERS